MRFDQRLERGFDGRIDEDGALAVGEYQLVSLNKLVRSARATKAKIDGAGDFFDLDYKAACEVGTSELFLDALLGAIARRNYTRVNKVMSRTNSGGALLKRVSQLRCFGPRDEAIKI